MAGGNLMIIQVIFSDIHFLRPVLFVMLRELEYPQPYL